MKSFNYRMCDVEFERYIQQRKIIDRLRPCLFFPKRALVK